MAKTLMMTEREIEACRSRYADLMLEIKERTLSVGLVAAGKTDLQGVLAREFCFLQLRMICECISIACLAAHVDMKEVQAPKFQKQDSAGMLINLMEKLHPDFFPIPINIGNLPDGTVHLTDKHAKHLTKAKLLKLLAVCGGALHRGPIKKYQFSPPQEKIVFDFQKIVVWSNQIFRLMETHKINLASGRDYLICSLFHGERQDVVVAHAGPKR